MYQNYIKRIIDILISGIALIILSPLFLIIALLVRRKLGRPVIFKQNRPGKDGKIFTIYKFRSMKESIDDKGDYLPDSQRLTRFGRVLRSSSLDELPELINILVGDMSIIGPRPLAVEYLPYYTTREAHRHDVRPGLTGLAQVNGRNAIQWEKRFDYDIFYVKNVSFVLDITILFRTVLKVLRRSDVIPLGEGIEEDFDIYRKKQMINGEKEQRNW